MSEALSVYDPVNNDPDHFSRYQDVYRGIFFLLGANENDTTTLERAVQVSQGWIRGDYGYNDGLPVELDGDGRQLLRHYCERHLGMAVAWDLPAGSYDSLLVFGASQFGNIRRTEQMAALLRSPEHTFNRVVLLGGERRLYEKEVAGLGRLLARKEVQQQLATDGWLAQASLDFARHFTDGADLSKVDPAAYRQFGETTQMRISMIAALGGVTLLESRQATNTANGTTVGVNKFQVAVGDAAHEVTLLHCPPHERKNGPPRHTTESCVSDLVNVLEIDDDARVAFIGAQPHLRRMQMTVERAFIESARPDVEVVATGPQLDDGTPVEICASEVAKTLYEASLLKQSRGA